MKLYVASSWRNKYQPEVVEKLRAGGHEVYDFRHPAAGNDGFSWAQIDPAWQSWTPEKYRLALLHPVARHGFGCDLGGMDGAEGCVLVLPCGRSAHLEAGWFMGRGLPVWILVPEPVEPELMYLLASGGAGALVMDVPELLVELAEYEPPYVCPGCFAVGEQPCAPGCDEARREREREDRQELDDLRGDYDGSGEGAP